MDELGGIRADRQAKHRSNEDPTTTATVRITMSSPCSGEQPTHHENSSPPLSNTH